MRSPSSHPPWHTVPCALGKSSKTDHLRVNVTGDQSGDTIKVQSVSLT